MADISELMANTFHLTSKEEADVDGVGGSTEAEGEVVTFDLLGCVLSEKTFSSHTLQSNIERILRPVMGLGFESLGDNRFILRFNHSLDRTHAMEGCPWLLDRCAMLLGFLPPEGNPETIELRVMTIVVRLANIPVGYRNPEVARRLCTNFDKILEIIPPKGEFAHNYIRARVQVNITEPLLRGVYLRLKTGTRQWIAFSYERMPIYCYLCGRVGHLEKKCKLRFGTDFVDPGTLFPYGEWMKSPIPGSRGSDATSQGTHSGMRSSSSEHRARARGVDIFGPGLTGGSSGGGPRLRNNSENIHGRAFILPSINPQTMQMGPGSHGNREEERSVVKVSERRNRKKKAGDTEGMEEDRRSKRPILGDITELFTVPVEAAQQPHRST